MTFWFCMAAAACVLAGLAALVLMIRRDARGAERLRALHAVAGDVVAAKAARDRLRRDRRHARRVRARFTRLSVCALLLLAGCSGYPVRDFCLLYAPVYTAPEDTEETRRAADGNNAVFMELCGAG